MTNKASDTLLRLGPLTFSRKDRKMDDDISRATFFAFFCHEVKEELLLMPVSHCSGFPEDSLRISLVSALTPQGILRGSTGDPTIV